MQVLPQSATSVGETMKDSVNVQTLWGQLPYKLNITLEILPHSHKEPTITDFSDNFSDTWYLGEALNKTLRMNNIMLLAHDYVRIYFMQIYFFLVQHECKQASFITLKK